MISLVIAIFVAMIVNLGSGLAVFLTNPRRPANQQFLTMTIAIGVWGTCVAQALNAITSDQMGFWIRQASGTATLIPTALNLLRLSIMHPDKSWWKTIRDSRWIIASNVIMIGICQTHMFMLGAEPGKTRMAIPQPVYGPGVALYAAYYIVLMSWMLVAYIRDTRNAKGMQLIELQFTLLGCGGGVVLGLTMGLALPLLTGHAQTAPLAPLSVVPMDIAIAYGIATRKIMGVAAMIQRIAAYVFLAAFLTAIYFSVRYASQLLLNPLVQGSSTWPHFLAALSTAFLLSPAHGRMQQFAARLIQHQETNVARIAQQSSRILQSVTTFDELLPRFAEIIRSGLDAEPVLLLLRESDGYRQAFPPSTHPQAPAVTLDAYDPLILLLREKDEPIVWDTVQRTQPTPQLVGAAATLRRLECQAATGILSKKELTGIMLIGPRLNGSIYGISEQNALQVLCDQLGIAIENAKLYTEAQNSRIYNDILLNSLVSGVVAANSDGIITVCNREALRIMARPSEQVVGWPAEVLPKPLADILKETLTRSERQADQDATLLPPSGDEIFVRVGSSTFHSHTGGILGALLVIHDVTNLKALQNQIRRSDRLASIGTLSAGMAHEIKNPLVTIKTFTQLLPERYGEADFRETFLALVGDEVKRIDRIVNQLLAFARPAKPRLAGMHVHEVLDKSLRLVEQEFLRKNITVERDYRVSDDVIMGDADLLSQALVNFFLNAREAMSDGGRLQVSTAHSRNHPLRPLAAARNGAVACVLIQIEDTGCGIKAENLSRIFDPFFTTKSEGTGLGLSVSHGIIEDHGGVLDVQSTVGKGTTVSIALPLLRKEDAA